MTFEWIGGCNASGRVLECWQAIYRKSLCSDQCLRIQLARRILSIRDNTTCWSGHRNYNLVVGPILLINKLVDVWGGIPPYNLLFLLFWATQFVDSGPFSNQHSVRLYRINKCCCWQHQFVDSGPFSNQHSVRQYRINKCCCWQHHLLRQTQNQQMLLTTKGKASTIIWQNQQFCCF